MQGRLDDALANKRASLSQRLRMSLAAAVQRVLPDGILLSVSQKGDAVFALNSMTMPVGNELAALPGLPLPRSLLESAEDSHALEAVLSAVEEHSTILFSCAADLTAKLGLVQVKSAWHVAPGMQPRHSPRRLLMQRPCI